MCVSLLMSDCVHFSPEASLNQKGPAPFGFTADPAGHLGKEKTDKTSLLCLCSPPRLALSTPLEWSKMKQEVAGGSGCGARHGGGLLLCNKTEQKQKYAD